MIAAAVAADPPSIARRDSVRVMIGHSSSFVGRGAFRLEPGAERYESPSRLPSPSNHGVVLSWLAPERYLVFDRALARVSRYRPLQAPIRPGSKRLRVDNRDLAEGHRAGERELGAEDVVVDRGFFRVEED